MCDGGCPPRRQDGVFRGVSVRAWAASVPCPENDAAEIPEGVLSNGSPSLPFPAWAGRSPRFRCRFCSGSGSGPGPRGRECGRRPLPELFFRPRRLRLSAGRSRLFAVTYLSRKKGSVSPGGKIGAPGGRYDKVWNRLAVLPESFFSAAGNRMEFRIAGRRLRTAAIRPCMKHVRDGRGFSGQMPTVGKTGRRPFAGRRLRSVQTL